MLSIKSLGVEELKKYLKGVRFWCTGGGAHINFESEQIKGYFNIYPQDKFLLIRYKGNKEELEETMKYINLPKRSYKLLFLLMGNSKATVDDMVEYQEAFSKYFDFDEHDAMLGVADGMYSGQSEVLLVTKIFCDASLAEGDVLSSLWEAVIDDLKMRSDAGFCESMRSMNIQVRDNSIELEMSGMTRSSLLMSLKRAEAEKYIEEYVGSEYTIEIK